ncbi:MAG: PKD domain-containing protein [Flavobacteriales bacterium]
MKKLVASAILLVIFNTAMQGQCDGPVTFCMQDATFQTCSGVLYDDGGATGAYSDQGYTLTLCPDTPGDVIQLDFSAFGLQTSPNGNNSDYLRIFDGNSASSNTLGDYTGNDLQGLQVTGTINNATGCITLVFDPNGVANTTFPGFEAAISCTTPCANPTSSFELAAPAVFPFPDGVIPLCIGEPITVSDNGSFAEPGFNLAQYVWNFDDGTIDNTSGSTANHTYTEPGEYFISLTVVDNNDCSSLNLEPIRVIVATIPQFPDLQVADTEFCLGEEITLHAGEIVNPTWTALPPQIVAGTTYLADGAGFSYSSTLTFDFFEEDAVLEDCSDLDAIMVNMEHSYMGDLGILITCPNGTSVDLVEWGVNGGGGTFLGEAIDNENQEPGLGYMYLWTPEATNGTWGVNSAGVDILPAGTYQSQQDLCDLVGCPLNGSWTFTVTDNIGIDNGYIFAWGVNFDPSLYPGITTFTPTVGLDADSSYWSGPGIDYLDGFHDDITINLTEPGTYEYVYSVVNNFGCGYDTTITIVVEQAPFITAGPDLVYNCEPLLVEGGFVGIPTPVCTVAEGNYTYCYSDNENYIQTFCPDNPGDGISAVEITINSGTTENFFDEFYVFDGDNTGAPIIAGPLYGDLSGMVFTATNADGCLTIQIQADGSSSCASGAQTELNFDVSCASPYDYQWAWTPATNISPSNSPVATLDNITATTTYTLTGFPTGHPECFVTDDMTVSVTVDMTIDVEEIYEACLNAEVNVLAPTITGGTAPYDINWTSETGQNINGDNILVIAVEPTEYCATVQDQCGTTQTACTTVQAYPSIPATFSISNPIGCEPLSVLMVSDYTEYQNVESMIWHFEDGDAISVMGSANHQYNNEGTYYPWLEIIDENGCIYYDTIASPVSVFPTPFAAFNVAPTELILPNTTANFNDVSIDASEYVYTFDQLGFGYSADTIFTFPAEIAATYNVQLWVTNQFGCVDSTVRQVIIRDDIDVYIPSAFTPDGDGINDVWQIKGAGFTSLNYHMVVFNRWGDVVFESTDPTQAWTGGYQNGSYFVQDGLYFYRAEIQDVEYDVKYLYEGHVLIAR